MQARRLAGFSLSHPVGRGGGGVVWRARHRSGADAAIKVVTSDRARTPRWIEAFEREIRTIAGLRHPGIVEVYDSGVVPDGFPGLEAGQPWLAMAWVDHTLSTWVRGEPERRRWTEARRILLELLEALGHAHAHGIVHLDVKPQNVLLDGSGRVRLADFGIASTPDDDTKDSSSGAGTPLFMAPERFHHGHPPVPATDLYSVGCLAYWLACGRPPFHLPPQALPRAHVGQAPPPLELPHRWPAGFAAWVEALLHKVPERRFELAADAAWALGALRHGARASAAPSVAPLPSSTTAAEWQTAASGPLDRAPATPGATAYPLPPIAPTWPTAVELGTQLGGAGLGLFGVRALPLVGRDAEREAAWAALVEVARTREPRLLWLDGPPGVGRSRLAEELVHAAHASGAAETLQAAHGPSGGGGHGFPAMLERWLPATAGLLRADLEDQIHRRLPDASDEDRSRLAAWMDDEALGPEERDRLVTLVLDAATRRRPAVLWLDDLDQEPEIAPLVARILRSRRPVLVVATAATEVTGELLALREGRRTRRLGLAPLPADAVRDLLVALLGLEPGLVDRVVERSAGVPLFAVHLVGDWVRRGVLEARDGGLQLAPGARADLPDDLHRLWLERLADLPDEASRGLEVAAVLGGLVTLHEWRATCERLGPSAPAVDPLARRGLLRGGPTGVELEHPLLRESLERRCRDEGRWVAVHLACAETLEPARHPRTRLRRARHLLEAGRPAEALPVAEAATAALRALGDFRAAARGVELAERAAGEADLPAVLELRARVEQELGAFEASVATCGRVLAVATGDLRRAGTALRLRGNARHMLGQADKAVRDLNAALLYLRAVGDAEQEGDCHQGLAMAAIGAGRPEEASAHLDRAEAVWTAHGGPEEWFAWLDWARADALVSLGDLNGATRAADRAERRFTAAGRTWQALLARGVHAEIAMEAGRTDEARARLEVQRAEADALGLGGAPRALVEATWAHHLVLSGRCAEAEPVLRQVIGELEGARWGRRLLGLWAALAVCRLDRGDEAGADRCLAEVEVLVAAHPAADRANVAMLRYAVERLAPRDPERARRFAGWLAGG